MKIVRKYTIRISNKNRKAQVMIGLIVAGVLAGLTSPAFAKEPVKWPITKFKVIQHDPRVKKQSNGKIDSKKDRRAELYLEKIGGTYQKKGFTPPILPTKRIDGKMFYVVNFSDWPDSSTIATTYNPVNKGEQALMIFDSSRIYGEDAVDLAPRGYAVLGHELFHSIQNGYPIKQENDLGGWIIEGTAQAVGMDFFFTHVPDAIDLIKTSDPYFVPTRRWGGRNYATPLRTKYSDEISILPKEDEREAMKNDGYQTSSLWRYIDEHIRTGGFPTFEPPESPDYSYLADFFSRPLPISGTREEKELKWLDENLKQHPKIKQPLSVIYARHVTDLAHYVPDRSHTYLPHKKFKTAASIRKWEEAVFEKCEKVTLTESQTSDNVTLSFAKVSARCIEVFYTGKSDRVGVGIALQNYNAKTLNSLHVIGVKNQLTEDISEIMLPFARKCKKPDSKHPSWWLFPNMSFVKRAPKNTRSNIFIISNVACDAAKTDTLKNVSFLVVYSVSKGTLNISKTGT